MITLIMVWTYDKKFKKFDKVSPKDRAEFIFDLLNAFNSLKNSSDTALFLQDLLTSHEVKILSKRLRIAKLLLSGKTQREVADTSHSGLETVSKVQNWLNEGGDGFKKVVANLPVKYELPEKLARKPLEFQGPQALINIVQYAVARSQDKRVNKFQESVKSK